MLPNELSSQNSIFGQAPYKESIDCVSLASRPAPRPGDREIPLARFRDLRVLPNAFKWGVLKAKPCKQPKASRRPQAA